MSSSRISMKGPNFMFFVLFLYFYQPANSRPFPNTSLILSTLQVMPLRPNQPRYEPLPTECIKDSVRWCPYISGYERRVGVEATRIEYRSNSPWYYWSSRNESRIPQTIVQACCACTQCVDQITGGQKKTFSEELKTLRLIGYRGGEDGRIEEIQEMIAVGCTCVRSYSGYSNDLE